MTEKTQPAADNTQPVFTIEKLYIRDLSVEVPNAPQVFLERENPQINVQLRTDGKRIDEGIYEVVLTVTVTAKMGEDKTFTSLFPLLYFQRRNGDELDVVQFPLIWHIERGENEGTLVHV